MDNLEVLYRWMRCEKEYVERAWVFHDHCMPNILGLEWRIKVLGRVDLPLSRRLWKSYFSIDCMGDDIFYAVLNVHELSDLRMVMPSILVACGDFTHGHLDTHLRALSELTEQVVAEAFSDRADILSAVGFIIMLDPVNKNLLMMVQPTHCTDGGTCTFTTHSGALDLYSDLVLEQLSFPDPGHDQAD